MKVKISMINTKEYQVSTIVPTSQIAIVNNFDAHKMPSLNSDILISAINKKVDFKPSDISDKEKEIAQVIATMKTLEGEHTSYVDEFVNRGNLVLYALLAKVYELAIQIELSDNKDSILKSLRTELKLRKNISANKTSTAMSMIVRWVVGGTRQLAHTYSKALEAAYNDNIGSSQIVSYFADGGLNKAKKKLTVQVDEKATVRSTEFKQFMRTADTSYESFQNTHIKWTEEVFGEISQHAMILGHNSGGGNIHGYRAFYLSADAYKKISKILADELFSGMRDEQITEWVS
jgi:hypothetical protein